MTRTGRPLLLNDDVSKKITDAIRAGAYFEDAVAYAGISIHTAYRWMREADDDDTVKGSPPRHHQRKFRTAVEHARASARLEHVLNIRNAAQAGDWRASAWYLERTEPGKWGASARLSVKNDNPPNLLAEMTRPIPEGNAVANDETRIAAIYAALEEAHLVLVPPIIDEATG